MTVHLKAASLDIEGPERQVLSPLRRLIRANGTGKKAGDFRVRFVEAAPAAFSRAAKRPAEETGVSRLAAANFAMEACHAKGCAEVLFKKNGLSDEMLADLAVQAFSFLMSPRGLFFLHSGAVSRRGKALVLVGRSMSGKTSLALSLSRRGFTLLSDEANILLRRGDEYRVAAFPMRTQVREAAFRHLPSLARRRASLPRTSNGKWILPSRRSAAEPLLGRLVFLEYAPAASPLLEPVGADALTPVFDACTSGYLSMRPGNAALLDYLLTLRALCRRGIVHRCVYSDSNRPRAVEALEKLAGEAVR